MIRVRLLGELELELDGRQLAPVATRQARSLLAWLVLHAGLHPRTRVASVFWPDVLETSARASLRTALATLRREAGPELAARIVADRDRVGIERGPEIAADLWDVWDLIAAGENEQALLLADGQLLTDLDDDWVLDARNSHRELVIDLLKDVGAGAAATGDRAGAVRHARRRLELDPLSEDAARVLMRCLALSGDRGAAAVVYDEFRAVLARDLGMAPSAETRALADELRAGSAMPASQELPPALRQTQLSPLVGRAAELNALRAAWRRASAGAALVTVVRGEAGAGKTRLLVALGAEVRAAGAIVLAGRCREENVVPFAPFTEALREYISSSGGPLPTWAAAELARLIPELGPVAVPEGKPDDARHRLFEAVAAVIGDAARRAPLLLVIEDLHWADRLTLAMLVHVVRTAAWVPLLVVGSLRDQHGAEAALHSLEAELARARRIENVTVGGLRAEEVADLAAAGLGRPCQPELAAALHRRTGGNALLVEELARHLAEQHPLTEEQLVAAARSDMPHGIRSLVEDHLARVPDPLRSAVTLGAVAGEEFAVGDIAAAAAIPDDVLIEELETAPGERLVMEPGVPGRYRFRHALVREAILAGVAPTRRALLHRRLAEALTARPGDRLTDLAHHLLEAGPLADGRTTATVALQAAERAMRSLAYEDAVQLIERAIQGYVDSDELRVELLLALGDARHRSGDGLGADRCFAEAADLARALTLPELLARAALGAAGLVVNVGPARPDVRALLEEALRAGDEQSPLRARLLARLGIELYYVLPPAERNRLSAEALAAGRRTGGRALLEALNARHVALWGPDHPEERLAIADELIAAARAAGEREAILQGVNWRVVDLIELGQVADARASIAEHERLAEQLRLRAYAWYAPMWRAMLALLAGRDAEARQLSAEGERIGRAAQDENATLLFEIQRLAVRQTDGTLPAPDRAAIRRRSDERAGADPAWRAWVAMVALAAGEPTAARLELERAMAGFASMSRDANWLYTATALGIVAAQLGDAATAEVLYPQLHPYRDRTVAVGRATVCTGSAAFSLGLLAAVTGDRAAAADHLGRAAAHNEALGAAPLAAAARDAVADLEAFPQPRLAGEVLQRL